MDRSVLIQFVVDCSKKLNEGFGLIFMNALDSQKMGRLEALPFAHRPLRHKRLLPTILGFLMDAFQIILQSC
ncbi:MAG: hypothetical protein COV67_08295 [Nitrospinae bacterium CG11_big_fil_rev_8_21_14_0_20_56_8]|nr:MAG: hypothetical protein COV67_08295 [Nitrospinae bacterium CG11_big_fil_rev_8_21_14_0_20_56_8]